MAAEAFNKISDTIAPSYHSFIKICTQKITESAIESVILIIPGVTGGIINAVPYFVLSINTFVRLVLSAQDSTGCCTNGIRPNSAVTLSFGLEISGTLFASVDVVVDAYIRFLKVWLLEMPCKLTTFLETRPLLLQSHSKFRVYCITFHKKIAIDLFRWTSATQILP